MTKLVLNFVGKDDWSRVVYEDEGGKMFKDTSLGYGKPSLCTVYGGFEGEPDTPIQYIEKYKNVEIVLTGKEEEPTEEERFNYMMLSRLKSDCDYYLGNGGRYTKFLWADDEEEHIAEMKKIYNRFDDGKKPEWLTWEEILKYEEQMCVKKNNITVDK